MATLMATKPELAVMRVLNQLNIDYEFQSKQLGGRQIKGGVVADFFIRELGLIISVVGEYWHYGRPDRIVQDKMQQIALESQGIRVIYIDATDALRNADFYVRDALKGISHSRFREL